MTSSPDRSGTGEPTRGSAQRCSTVIACLRMSGYYTGEAAHPLRGSDQYPALLTCRCRREMVFHRGAPERSAPSLGQTRWPVCITTHAFTTEAVLLARVCDQWERVS